jgi:hypothetical protein
MARKIFTTEQIIGKLREAEVLVSVIVTIHNLNGKEPMLSELLQFCDWLCSVGVVWINFHTLQSSCDAVRQKCGLSEDETVTAFIKKVDDAAAKAPAGSRKQMALTALSSKLKDVQTSLAAAITESSETTPGTP